MPDSPCGLSTVRRSHSLDEVQHFADWVAIIRNGRLTYVDAVEQLRQRALRDVTILFAEPVDAGRFAALDGVRVEGSDGSVLQLSAPEPAVDAAVKGPCLIRSSISFPSRPSSRRSSSSCTRSPEMAVELTRRGLLDHRRALAGWCLGVIGNAALVASIFPSIKPGTRPRPV